VEAAPDLPGCIERIRGAGARVGLAVSPDTEVEVLAPFLHVVNQVLIMTVQPGFAGATFLPEMIGKVRWVRRRAVEAGLEIDVEVDGGINPATIPALAAAGRTCSSVARRDSSSRMGSGMPRHGCSSRRAPRRRQLAASRE